MSRRKFQIFLSATDSEIDAFSDVLLKIESNLTRQDTYQKLVFLKKSLWIIAASLESTL